jgi:hypothetical protein
VPHGRGRQEDYAQADATQRGEGTRRPLLRAGRGDQGPHLRPSVQRARAAPRPSRRGEERARQELCSRISLAAPYFRVQLTRTSTPEELFGPVSLKALEQDSYRRKTTGMLPEAKVAFIDEVFKCLAGDTIVTLPDGSRRRIDSFSCVDLPVLHAIEGTSLVTGRAKSFVRRASQEVYRLILASDKRIRATPDHKFLVRYPGQKGTVWKDWSEPRWAELATITRGSFVATPAELPVEGSRELPDHEVSLAALLLADGGCTQPQIRYTKNDPELIGLARRSAQAAGDELVEVPRSWDLQVPRHERARAGAPVRPEQDLAREARAPRALRARQRSAGPVRGRVVVR